MGKVYLCGAGLGDLDLMSLPDESPSSASDPDL